MRLLPALLALALPLGSAPAPRPLDVTLAIDAPRSVVAGFKPPFKVELAFTVENPGSRLVTFTGQCPWEDPSRSLTRRWQGGVVLEPMDKARALKGIRYLIRDRDGRKVAALTGPDARIHPESLKGIVLRLTVGNLGEPGGAIEHRLALEF